MSRDRLTPDRIRKFQCPASTQQTFLWDTDMPRLAVRATATAKAFVFQGKLSGKVVRITIGGVKAWTIDNARGEARRLQTFIDQGIDPRDEKANREAEREAARNTEERGSEPAIEAWKVYVEDRSRRWGDWHRNSHDTVSKEGGAPIVRGKKTTKDGKTQPGILRPLLMVPLAEITADAVSDWLKKETAVRPTQAALAFRLLRAFINWCAEHESYADQVSAVACTARKVREEVPKKRVKDDCLQREQLAVWFEAVTRIPNPVIAAYLQTVLLTGARRAEIAGLKWEDVDFRWNSMLIRDKVEGERTIPLTPYVAALLDPLPRRNEWVFSSLGAKSGRLNEPRLQHNRACTTVAIEGMTIHGLRRSFGTLAEWVECPAGVSAQIMGHKPSATAEKHYRRRPLDLLRKWHTVIEAWILEEAGIEQPKVGERGLRAV